MDHEVNELENLLGVKDSGLVNEAMIGGRHPINIKEGDRLTIVRPRHFYKKTFRVTKVTPIDSVFGPLTVVTGDVMDSQEHPTIEHLPPE